MERYEAAVPDVVSEDIEGELLVINLATGVYFRGQGASAQAWKALSSGVPVEQFDAASQAAVRAFVAELLADGLIRALPGTEAPASMTTVSLSDSTLRLERFEDLADMLALDPVHDVDPKAGWPFRK